MTDDPTQLPDDELDPTLADVEPEVLDREPDPTGVVPINPDADGGDAEVRP